MDDASILDTVARATRLREGPAGVAAVLRAVYRAGSLRLQDAAPEEGRGFVETALGLGVTHDMSCPACGGRGIVIPANVLPQVERLSTIIAKAPSLDVTLDQSPCTPETAFLRALLMLRSGALEGRKVLILGDDDSLSVAIG